MNCQLFQQNILELIRRTSAFLPPDVENVIQFQRKLEASGSKADFALELVAQNIGLAKAKSLPICQDTGTINFFFETPRDVDQLELEDLCRQAVKDATEGRGVDVVVETVGEATWERSLAAAGQEGRIVVCGATSGHSPPARLYRLWWKQLVIYGSTMGLPSDFEGAYELIRTGRARVHIDTTFPLAEAAKAHERLESGAQFGKVVLTVP